MLRVVILALLFTNIYATTFKVASYNVENLFDLNKDNSEYKEYIPYTKSKWNKQTFTTKLKNTIKVLKDLDSNIIALQEIENKKLLKILQKNLPKYKYISFIKYKNSSIGLGFLSKIEILQNKSIDVRFKDKLFRPILETTFKLDNIEFKIFNNHWPSKRVSESYRIKYAKKLKNRLDKLPRDYDYILLGDFNSNHNEKESFLFNKKLNNTLGITGINHILNTSFENKYINYRTIKEKKLDIHYNLWFEKENKNRFSNKFRGENNTPDNILLNPALFDNKKISYIKNSFRVHKPRYLYENGKIKRWKMKNRIHQNNGYSDHLPIYASFSTSKEKRNSLKNYKEKVISSTNDLYKVENLNDAIILDDVYVIYKTSYGAIFKQKNRRAIYYYGDTKNLKVNYKYKLKVHQLKNFNGLKELTKIEILKEYKTLLDNKALFTKADNINLFDGKNQNEIITNLKGLYKKGYLYFKDKKIKIYSKNKSLLPRNNQNITIISGHLASYRGKIQIIIHKKSDYKEVEF